MKKSFFLTVFIVSSQILFAQVTSEQVSESCDCIAGGEELQFENFNALVDSCINETAANYSLEDVNGNFADGLLNQLAEVNAKLESGELKGDTSISVQMNDIVIESSIDKGELKNALLDQCEVLKVYFVLQMESGVSYEYKSNEKAQNFYAQGYEATQQSDFKKAVKFYEKAVKADPDYVIAWDNLGVSYRQLGKIDEAIDAYKKSLSLFPSGPMALQNLAVAYTYKNDFESAAIYYDMLKGFNPMNPEAYYGLGHMYFQTGENVSSLDNLCIAHTIYVQLKSPYIQHTGQLISAIYLKMQEADQLEEFDRITKKHKIKISD